MTTKRQRKYSQDFSGDSITQQHFKDSCDVNRIIQQYAQTGIDPNPENLANQKFGFATSKDFAESAFAVAEIRSAFAAQPSNVRSHFANDPERWLDSLNEPEAPEPEKTPPEVPQEALAPQDSTPDREEK